MRITRPFAKLLFVLSWIVLTLMLVVASASSGLGFLVGDLATIGFVIVGVRTFRGRGEDVRRPRPWWRASGAPTASYVIGTTAGLAVALSLFGLILSAAGFLLVAAVQFALAAAFYIHSGYRLARAAPQPLHADYRYNESPRRATAG